MTRLPGTVLSFYRTGRARRVYPAVSAPSVDVADGKSIHSRYGVDQLPKSGI